MSDLEALIQRYVDCYNRMEIDDMMECVSDSVTFENFSNAGQSMQMNGKDALRQVAEARAWFQMKQRELKDKRGEAQRQYKRKKDAAADAARKAKEARR